MTLTVQHWHGLEAQNKKQFMKLHMSACLECCHSMSGRCWEPAVTMGEWQHLMVSHGWQVQGGTAVLPRSHDPNLGHPASVGFGTPQGCPNSLDVVTKTNSTLSYWASQMEIQYGARVENLALPSIMRMIDGFSDAHGA